MKKNNYKKIFKKYWHWPVVIALAAGFFLATGAFNYYTQDYRVDGDFVKWASPDETANYVFSKLFGQTGELTIFEKYNLLAGDIMHPRSFRSDGGNIKPVSFLGMILLYGTIVKLTTYKILPYLTPLFASLGLVYYFLLIKRLFGRSNAVISVFVLAAFPVYTYYTARSMFHNILFIVFLIISLYYGISMAEHKKSYGGFVKMTKAAWQWVRKGKFIQAQFGLKKSAYAAIGGTALGMAVAVRTSEAIWLLPLFAILYILNIRQIRITKLVIFISFAVLSVLPTLYYNQILYGSPWFGGYPAMNDSIVAIKDSGAEMFGSAVAGQAEVIRDAAKKIFDTIFFFGFHPRQSIRLADAYIRGMFPWLFWFGLFGLAVFAANWRKRKRRHWIYLAGLACVSSFLIIYYGSWRFSDNPDLSAITIGNSYTRYWLPVYLGIIPLLSYFLIRLSNAFCAFGGNSGDSNDSGQLSMKFSKSGFGKTACRFTWRSLIVGIVAISSFTYVMSGTEEGLVYLARQQADARQEFHRVLDLTENNAVIITRYHDKLFFPERKVIVGLFDDPDMVRTYAMLVDSLPVYYYNFTFPQKDLDYLNNRRLYEAGLNIEPVEQITSDFTLYRLVPLAN